jgi:dTDP-L-rhamnose 4-epimerase
VLILVTGGAGFVGSHVVDALADRGHAVRVLDGLHPNAHGRQPDYTRPDVDYRWVDLRDVSGVRDAVSDVEAVCHQASMVGLGRDFTDVGDYVDANDVGTATLLRALHDRDFRGHLVLASSMVVYGDGHYRCRRHGPVRPQHRSAADITRSRFEPLCPQCADALVPEAITEDAPTAPRSVYAATKLHQEHLCNVYGDTHDIAVTTLRYHNVYGPRMPRDTPYAGVASIFRSALESGRAPEVLEDGGQLRDFVHVADVARANVLALEAPDPYDGPLNIATGTPHSVLDLAEALFRAGGGDLAPRIVGGYRPGDVRHVFGATCGAQGRLGFVARIPFEEGIRDFAGAPLREPASHADLHRSSPDRPASRATR